MWMCYDKINTWLYIYSSTCMHALNNIISTVMILAYHFAPQRIYSNRTVNYGAWSDCTTF